MTAKIIQMMFIGLLIAVSAAVPHPQRVEAPGPPDALAPRQHIVHRFDFDERALGNVEEVPKYWIPLRPTAFPRFAVGRFDSSEGHAAPPSFHLESNGRNVAYIYNGPETRIRPNIAYRITGFIKPDRIDHSRACLSAHYVTKFGETIPDTMVRSTFVGEPDAGDGWQEVELRLSAAPPDAQTIGLIAWVLQRPTWDTTFDSSRDIASCDIHAGAWFDDLGLETMPRVELSTSSITNVLTGDATRELRVLYVAADSTAPDAELSILNANGDLVERQPIGPTTELLANPQRIPLGEYAPGLYEARFELPFSRDETTIYHLGFAVVANGIHPNTSASDFLGIVLDPLARCAPNVLLAALESQRARSIKVPLWTSATDDARVRSDAWALDRTLPSLVKRNYTLTGVLVGPPSLLSGRVKRSLLDVLAGDPKDWQEPLAVIVAPHAGILRSWQIGSDASPYAAGGELVQRAAVNVRSAMQRFMTSPSLTLPLASSLEWKDTVSAVEQVSVHLGDELDPHAFKKLIDGARKRGYTRVAAYVEPLPANQYHRVARVADWAQRVLAARHAGADVVYVPQTWRVRESAWGTVAEPTEEFIVLRTLADALADTFPAQSLDLGDGVTCLAFGRGDSQTSTLALWDSQAPEGGRRHTWQLGQATRSVDLWGRERVLERDDRGRQLVELSGVPIIVEGVENWLLEFTMSTLSIEPAHVESGTELVRHSLHVDYRGGRPLSGTIKLQAPDTWEIVPRDVHFNLQPNQVQTKDLEIRYPHNEAAGKKTVRAQVTLTETGYFLEIPLTIDIGLTHVEVWGSAVVDGESLVLRHVVANRSERTVHFRGAANVSERERQYRPFSGLQPGETQTVEYRFADAASLIGSKVRLTLNEMNDGPRSHTLELVVP